MEGHDRRGDVADELDLFTTQQARTFDQNDACVHLPRSRELVEVVNIRRHQHAILLVRTFEQLPIGRAEDAAIPNSNDGTPSISQRVIHESAEIADYVSRVMLAAP